MFLIPFHFRKHARVVASCRACSAFGEIADENTPSSIEIPRNVRRVRRRPLLGDGFWAGAALRHKIWEERDAMKGCRVSMAVSAIHCQL